MGRSESLYINSMFRDVFMHCCSIFSLREIVRTWGSPRFSGGKLKNRIDEISSQTIVSSRKQTFTTFKKRKFISIVIFVMPTNRRLSSHSKELQTKTQPRRQRACQRQCHEVDRVWHRERRRNNTEQCLEAERARGSQPERRRNKNVKRRETELPRIREWRQNICEGWTQPENK